MNLVVIDVEELEKLIRKIIREEMGGRDEWDEIGGIELAAQITGLAADTIYKKVQRKEIPFRQEFKGCKIRFSRNDLMKWMGGRRKGS